MSFPARIPCGRATFLCVAKERWPTRASGTRENGEAGPKGGGQDARSKEGTPREHALRPSMGCGFASGRRGSPKAHPCTCGELARMTRHIHVTRPSCRLRHSNRQSCRFSLRAILRTFPSSARRVRGAPVGAHDSPHPTSMWLALRVACEVQIGSSPADLVCVRGSTKQMACSCFKLGQGRPATQQGFPRALALSLSVPRRCPDGTRSSHHPRAARSCSAG